MKFHMKVSYVSSDGYIDSYEEDFDPINPNEYSVVSSEFLFMIESAKRGSLKGSKLEITIVEVDKREEK